MAHESKPDRNSLTLFILEPTQTLNIALSKNSLKYVSILLVLGSFSKYYYGFWFTESQASELSVVSFLGLFLTLVMVCLYGVGLASVGKLIGGIGSIKQSLIVTACSLIPMVILLVIYLILFTSSNAFEGLGLLKHSNTNSFSSFDYFFKSIFLFWGTYILFKGVMLIHGFSFFRAFSAILIVGILITLVSALNHVILNFIGIG